MEINPIFKIFESFPRQGPGDDEHTKKAFSIIAEPPKRGGEILDVGCGKGVQTMALARLVPSCRIIATDIHQPFLEAVDEKVQPKVSPEESKRSVRLWTIFPLERRLSTLYRLKDVHSLWALKMLSGPGKNS